MRVKQPLRIGVLSCSLREYQRFDLPGCHGDKISFRGAEIFLDIDSLVKNIKCVWVSVVHSVG